MTENTHYSEMSQEKLETELEKINTALEDTEDLSEYSIQALQEDREVIQELLEE